MNRNYRLRNIHKLKGDLDERISRALDEMANSPDVLEVIVPDESFKHLKQPGFEIRGVYTTVKGSIVKVALLSHKGYGKVVDLVSSGVTGARNIAEYIHNMKRKPLDYFPVSS